MILKIGQHFLCSIFNGDDSGLTDEEIAELDYGLSQYPRGDLVPLDDSEDEFARCDITGMMGATVDVLLIPYQE